jgi:hypothetical protein
VEDLAKAVVIPPWKNRERWVYMMLKRRKVPIGLVDDETHALAHLSGTASELVGVPNVVLITERNPL